MTSPRLSFLAARATLTSASLALCSFCATAARAQPEPPRLAVRLDYRPGPGTEYCPTEHSVRVMLNRLFGYDAIQSTARPTLTLAISRLPGGKGYETMLAVSDELGRVLWDEVARSNITSCTEYVMYAAVMLQMVAADRLRPPRPPPPEFPSEPLPPPAPRPAAPAPASPSDTPMPPPAPAAFPRRPVEGFLFNAGLSLSYGLTPTVSLGGIGSLMYRRGEYSGALEARVDHGLVPAHFIAFPIESLFAGATLALPCAHRGAFSGCLVTEAGRFSFSSTLNVPLGGPRWLFALGLRANLEWPITEHSTLRAFAQASAVPVGAHLVLSDNVVWRSLPGFGTVGFTILVNR